MGFSGTVLQWRRRTDVEKSGNLVQVVPNTLEGLRGSGDALSDAEIAPEQLPGPPCTALGAPGLIPRARFWHHSIPEWPG